MIVSLKEIEGFVLPGATIVKGPRSRMPYLLPRRLVDGLTQYTQDRLRPGDFLCAVLANDLFDAARRADPWSLLALPALTLYIREELPTHLRGSYEAISAWCNP